MSNLNAFPTIVGTSRRPCRCQ